MKTKKYITPFIKVYPIYIDSVNYVVVSKGNNENGDSAKLHGIDSEDLDEQTEDLW